MSADTLIQIVKERGNVSADRQSLAKGLGWPQSARKTGNSILAALKG